MKRLEPIFWMLFGAGAMVASMLLPAFFLMLVIGFPLGWFGTPEETYSRLRFMLANPVSRIAFGLCISLIFWHSAHHLRHFAYDLGLHSVAGLVSAVVSVTGLVWFVQRLGGL